MVSERVRLVGSMKSSKQYYFKMSAIFTVIVVIFIFCFVKSSASDEYKVVETIDGKVRGVRDTTLIKRLNFYSFKGIPYAKIPTGELRFKVSFGYFFESCLQALF